MEYNQQIYEEPQGSIVKGTIGALIGALLGAVVWAIVGILGYMASFVGFLIAFLAGKGYDKLGGRPGKIKLLVLILCVILAVVAGNAGTLLYQVHEVYVEQGYASYIGEAEFFRMTVPMLMNDADVTDALVQDTLTGLFFAALGCFSLLKQTVSKKPQQPAAEAAQPENPEQ